VSIIWKLAEILLLFKSKSSKEVMAKPPRSREREAHGEGRNAASRSYYCQRLEVAEILGDEE